MPTPIISIVGKSNSGKTTLIENLIPELTKRGYRVATIKHNVHGFDIDHEGKDSWRHKKAGAFATVIACPTRIALIEDIDHDQTLDEIRDKYNNSNRRSSSFSPPNRRDSFYNSSKDKPT